MLDGWVGPPSLPKKISCWCRLGLTEGNPECNNPTHLLHSCSTILYQPTDHIWYLFTCINRGRKADTSRYQVNSIAEWVNRLRNISLPSILFNLHIQLQICQVAWNSSSRHWWYGDALPKNNTQQKADWRHRNLFSTHETHSCLETGPKCWRFQTSKHHKLVAKHWESLLSLAHLLCNPSPASSQNPNACLLRNKIWAAGNTE